MPLSNGGKYFSNPALAKRDDSIDAPDDSAEEQQSESPAVSHHIFKTPSGFSSTLHREDGSKEDQDHASYDEASQYGQAQFGGEDQDGEVEELEEAVPGQEEKQY